MVADRCGIVLLRTTATRGELGRSGRVCYLGSMKARLGIGFLLVLAAASAIFFIRERAQDEDGPVRPEGDAGSVYTPARTITFDVVYAAIAVYATAPRAQ